MGFDRYFGFNLTQRKTLERLLAALDLSDAQLAAINTVAGLPTTDPADGESIWNDEGTLKVASTA